MGEFKNTENPVRVTTLEVVKKAKDVKINQLKIKELAKEWAKNDLVVPSWPKEYHLKTDNEKALLDYIILLTSINFCFWSQDKRWEIRYDGKKYNGYFGLSLALKKFFSASAEASADKEENREKASLNYFSKISFKEFKDILQGGKNLLLLKERWEIIRKVSSKIIKKYGNSINFFASANGKCSVLVKKVYEELFSFDDISEYQGKKIYFLKRPQILIADVWGIFEGKGIAEFEDMDYLTCFPDYKVPQVLNHFGILEYSGVLCKKIKNRIPIPHNSKQEIEIRSATVWGVEYLKNALAKEGKSFCSFEVDWILWNKAQGIEMKKPYHLTKTVFY